MVYLKTEERRRKLEEAFLEKVSDKLKEYKYLGRYINKDTKALFEHKCGHQFMMTPHNFKAGHGCPKCASEHKRIAIMNSKGSKFLDIINNSEEYELLDEYTGSKKSVRVLHKTCGRVFSRVPSTVNNKSFSGELCSLCVRDKDTEKKKYTVDGANRRLGKVNKEYEFITYNGASNIAKVKHKICGHIFEEKAAYFLLGDGHCPKCTTNISKEEREIYEWFKTICPDAVQCDREILNGKELDMYSPSKKVAIEFNGYYWHSAKKLMDRGMTYAEAKRYHHDKSSECERAGVRLIHIWDYEWADERKRAVLKNIILGATSNLKERYFARNCEVVRYNQDCPRWKEINEFFKQNNIQGNRGGKFVYTLEIDGRILMAYKFGKPSVGKAKRLYEYEMVRGASAPGVQVIGGATKLWKHFIDEVRPNSVVYYIDYNYFNGKSVEQIGLEYVCSQPGVKNYWFDTGEVKNREPKRHKEIKELVKQEKVLELWNAGTKVYRYTRTP